MKRLAFLMGLVALFVAANHRCRANDTLTYLDAGGLHFEKADGISMQREDLYLSPSEVRVRYEMRNDRGAAFEGRVAFPLPELSAIYEPIEIPFPEETNFVHFKVLIDGTEIQPEVSVRAIFKDHDITDQLSAAGLVVNTKIVGGFYNRTMSAATKDRLIAMGFLEEFQGDADLNPLWSIRVSYHWKQTFKPGITLVEHRYVPVVGGWYFSIDDANQPDWIELGDERRRAYCIDAATERAIRNIVSSNSKPLVVGKKSYGGGIAAWAWTLPYILKTAANWDGPIGTFHLTLDGGGAGHAISLCLPDLNLTRKGPAKFEATATNFIPKNDLVVLFVGPDNISNTRR
jgi:Domain of unknown function (DUF4424)